jgi:hypothetical protein
MLYIDSQGPPTLARRSVRAIGSRLLQPGLWYLIRLLQKRLAVQVSAACVQGQKVRECDKHERSYYYV